MRIARVRPLALHFSAMASRSVLSSLCLSVCLSLSLSLSLGLERRTLLNHNNNNNKTILESSRLRDSTRVRLARVSR